MLRILIGVIMHLLKLKIIKFGSCMLKLKQASGIFFSETHSMLVALHVVLFSLAEVFLYLV